MKHRLGCQRDTNDARDHIFRLAAIALPASVDLRAHCPPVMDQGQLGSCTAHGITGALRYMLIKNGGDVPLSRLQLYYDERVLENTVASDAGAQIRDGIKTAAAKGVGHESLWPYDISKFSQKPSAMVYADAVQFEALTYQRILTSITAIKTALAQGFPVIIGISVYESFEDATNGVIPMPNVPHEQLVGGHCMYVVGYNQRPGYFTVRNSWGTDWGDNGDCYIPQNYLGSSNLGSDYWVIQSAGRRSNAVS